MSCIRGPYHQRPQHLAIVLSILKKPLGNGNILPPAPTSFSRLRKSQRPG